MSVDFVREGFVGVCHRKQPSTGRWRCGEPEWVCLVWWCAVIALCGVL